LPQITLSTSAALRASLLHMQVDYFHVDAFTARAFGGNPAGVCPLKAWLPDATLQAMAAEHKHAETAFAVKEPEGDYALRWFTPETEVDLCGHATLATAHVLWRHGYEAGRELTFITRSGPLTVTREDDLIVMDFPSRPAAPIDPPPDVGEILSATPLACWKSRDYLFEFKEEETVRALRPDFTRLAKWNDVLGVIVTAPGREVDFVSRFFAPRVGVPEDPVTGSAHCTLIPFWSGRLGKTKLHARQISPRGGEIFCEAQGDRVKISGHAVTYLKGTIEI
jgi:predicted PhzF superfamily epimerase YddE/YHI9